MGFGKIVGASPPCKKCGTASPCHWPSRRPWQTA